MGLEKIKEEILQKAAAAEKAILEEAAVQSSEIRKKAEEKAKQLEHESLQNLQAETKSIENREQSLQNMEAKKMIFEVKKHAIDHVYSEAYSKIKKIPKKEREHIVKTLMEHAKKEIDIGTVYANSVDKEFAAQFTVKPADIDGGIICESKDGTVRVDYTFATLFHDLREKTIKETSNILFD